MERDDTYGNYLLGEGVTLASGVFTFPTAGIWQVTSTMQWEWSTDSESESATGFDSLPAMQNIIMYSWDNGTTWRKVVS